MLLTGWLKRWQQRLELLRLRRPRRLRRRAPVISAAECFEARTLLSVVTVTIASGVIGLSGDTDDNSFTADVDTGNASLDLTAAN